MRRASPFEAAFCHRTVGGACVNRGCLPSKNLIEAAKLVHDARNPRYPGLTPADLRPDFRALVEQKDASPEAHAGGPSKGGHH